MKIQEHDRMEDDSNEAKEELLFGKKDVRSKKEKKRQHRSTKDKEECTRESFKKMKEEIDELRRKETERAKELEELKQKIVEKETTTTKPQEQEEFALGFDKGIYLSKGFIESAQWINNVLAKSMNEKMSSNENKERFEVLRMAKRASRHLGIRACARFNRGEECSLGKWHTTHQAHPYRQDALWTKRGENLRLQNNGDRQQERHTEQKKNEIRLHVCTLCLDALGTANGHSVLECPWILKKNWKN